MPPEKPPAPEPAALAEAAEDAEGEQEVSSRARGIHDARGKVQVPANFERLVLGCTEADFFK